MKVQDIFGAAPKTVLNKPYMHVQHQEPTNINGGASIAGENQRIFNTVLLNDIPGASLSGGAVTLPAGVYHISGDSSNFSYNVVTSTQAKILVDDAVVLVGSNTSFRGSSTSDYQIDRPSVEGTVVLAQPSSITLVMYASVGKADNGLGLSIGQSVEVYGNLQIWKLDSNIDTPVVSDPTMVLARPLFHARDEVASGAYGGTNLVGANHRALNTIITNEISGVTLSGNEVELPAGTYHISASAPGYQAGDGKVTIEDDVGNVLLEGPNSSTGGTAGADVFLVEGQLTLLGNTKLRIIHYLGTARTSYGLGRSSSYGDTQFFSEIKIWQLDAVRQTPVLVNDKLYPLPGDTMVTGNMHGLEYEYTSANTITVQPGICMDSTNTEVLSLTTQQVVSIPTTINTVFNLFLCDDGVVRTDTDVDGATLAATSDALRWIGFVVTDASGDILEFEMSDDDYWFVDGRDQVILSSTISTTYVQVSLAPFCPVSRVRYSHIAAMRVSEETRIYTSANAIDHYTLSIGTFVGGRDDLILFRDGWWIKSQSTSYNAGDIGLCYLNLKR